MLRLGERSEAADDRQPRGSAGIYEQWLKQSQITEPGYSLVLGPATGETRRYKNASDVSNDVNKAFMLPPDSL